ncbi:universal stress protein [Bacteriovoracaceae bacterium]|nr:universal stress protein [Bacteriovoracaceae bacterium]
MSKPEMLVAIDLSNFSQTVIKAAFEYCEKMNYSPTFIYVDQLLAEFRPSEFILKHTDITEVRKTDLEEEKKEKLIKLFSKESIPSYTFEVWKGHPVDGILNSINNNQSKLLFTGLRGHNRLHQFFLGSVAQRLIEMCPIPQIAIHENFTGFPQKPLLCIDGTDSSKIDRFSMLYDMVKISEGRLDLLHIINLSMVFDFIQGQSEGEVFNKAIKTLELKAMDKLQKAYLSCQFSYNIKVSADYSLPEGEHILKTATMNENDLIVLGSNQYKGLKKFFMGSTTNFIAKEACMSIMIVK